ncbi:hypothetical protein C8Q76DRAFT_801431 [Earliella scabrosa]|nr:hypothetical protein C8Q76DRAFT_801431 [Earliella scabrosa]
MNLATGRLLLPSQSSSLGLHARMGPPLYSTYPRFKSEPSDCEEMNDSDSEGSTCDCLSTHSSMPSLEDPSPSPSPPVSRFSSPERRALGGRRLTAEDTPNPPTGWLDARARAALRYNHDNFVNALVHQRTDPEVMRRFCEFWGVPPVDQPEAASFPHAPRDPELQDRLANLSERVHLAAAQELALSRQPSQSPERSQSTQRSRSMGTATEFTSSIHTSPRPYASSSSHNPDACEHACEDARSSGRSSGYCFEPID